MSKSTQNDDTTFYIVDEELALLTPENKKAWAGQLKKETLTAYETPEQLDARMKSVNYDKYPELRAQIDAFAREVQSGKMPTLSFSNFPEEAIDSFLFSIGASGISAFIDLYLRQKEVVESTGAMEAVAALSRARHKILEKNQAVFA